MAVLDSRLNPDQWADPLWRLHNLYWIITEEGKKIPFRPNDEQIRLIENLHSANLILKARRLGFTTLIALIGLDQCIFNSNYTAGIIAHSLDDARKIFRNKVKFPYMNLPDQLIAARALVNDSASELVFNNGSSMSVATSMRSGTLQLLHVSEFGKICRKYPERAREIVTGSFDTVKAGQFLFVESTAEGRGGYFYDFSQKAQKLLQQGARLTPLDFRFHFFPWYEKRENRLDPDGVVITQEMREYFDALEAALGIRLDDQQRAWYVKKHAQLTGDGKIDEDMKREHPSTPDEAFQVAVLGAIYGKQMAFLRANKRIRSVPHVPSMPVNTFWDLGHNNVTAIWFHQYIANEHRFIHYHEKSGEDLAYFVKVLQDRGYLYGAHYLPHDAEHQNLERNESRVDRLVELGIDRAKIVVVDRITHLDDGIELTRKMLPQVLIDESGCALGIIALDNYQFEWDDKLGTFKQTPLKNNAANGADAFRQFAQGWETPQRGPRRSKSTNWRTA